MYSNRIIFGDYNNHLISRLHSRAIFNDFMGKVDKSKEVQLDFSGVRVVTLSFATELFSNIEKCSLRYTIMNDNQFVREILGFAVHSTNGLHVQ
tara:strand:+ start:358018 stop:358299 length:282 start_codon:yes stop_codon:yes gene_type:complete